MTKCGLKLATGLSGIPMDTRGSRAYPVEDHAFSGGGGERAVSSLFKSNKDTDNCVAMVLRPTSIPT